MSRSPAWKALGIKPTRDAGEIRRAYAGRLKQIDPEADPEGFRALRSAYEWALQKARSAPVETPPEPEADEDEHDETEVDPPPEPEAEAARPRPAPAPFGGEAPIRLEVLVERHRALLDTLAARLTGETPASPDQLRLGFDTILASQAMENITIYDQTQVWLARQLLNAAPRGDDLLAAAVAAFGWRERPVSRGADPWTTAAAARHVRLARLAEARRNREAGLLALTSPLTPARRLRYRITHGLEAKVGVWLSQLSEDGDLPGADLDATALAWWRRRVSGPRMSARALWLLGITSLWATLAALTESQRPPEERLLILLAPAVSAAIWFWGVQGMRHWVQGRIGELSPTGVVRAGWLYALAALAVLAPFAAPPAARVALVAAAAGLCLWAIWTSPPDTGPYSRRTRIRTGVWGALQLGWLLTNARAFHGPAAVNLTVILTALTLAGICGSATLQGLAQRATPRLWLGGLAVMSLLAVGLAALPESGPQIRGVAVALALVAVLASRPLMQTGWPWTVGLALATVSALAFDDVLKQGPPQWLAASIAMFLLGAGLSLAPEPARIQVRFRRT